MHPFKHAVPQWFARLPSGVMWPQASLPVSIRHVVQRHQPCRACGSLKADRWTPILRPLLTSHGGMVVIRRTPNA